MDRYVRTYVRKLYLLYNLCLGKVVDVLCFFDLTDTAGRDFQSGVVQPYFPRGRRALFFVPIVRDRARENAECFYMTLTSPRDGESYDPVIRAWTPSRALGWIQGEIGMLVNKSGACMCLQFGAWPLGAH